MNYIDSLPLEILHEIAQKSEPAYYALLAYPRFARAITPGTRCDYMIDFGHDIYVSKDSIDWMRNGKRHRKDGPAIIRVNGDKEWFWNGWYHRDDGAAIIRANDVQCWYRNGNLHRNGGPAIDTRALKIWYQNGKYHREDGPAMTGGRMKRWYQNGNLHRVDGPAVILHDGTVEYYQNGKQYSDDGHEII